MNIGVLTSSRADYGIYLPLLKRFRADNAFNLKLFVFGTHVSAFHGLTKNQIIADGFEIYREVESLVLGDSPEAIASAMGLTQLKFSTIWQQEQHTLDLLFCLGDRYEMFAAVMAAVPFNISIAHIHGGETTIGAIDNIFRHSLTIASSYHFTSNQVHADRVAQIIATDKNIFDVGSLSLDNLKEINFFSIEEFRLKFGVDLSLPTVLVTYHPETVALHKNEQYIKELISALSQQEDQILITMPNADTQGNVVRGYLTEFASQKTNVYTVESLGTQGYFSAMQYCQYMLGNSSSGIIEGASFNKYVINIGDRQKGREAGENVLHCPVQQEAILACKEKVKALPPYNGYNIYGIGNAAETIIKVLKQEIKAS